ncbi:MAG: ATP-binding protein [Clostridia bacterium]|nr:ATP-binding protein [Clostridia bacterium]
MKYTLRTKLSFLFVILALVSVSLISILTNFFLEKQFKEYITKNLKKSTKEIVTSIGQQYSEGGQWNYRMLESIGVNALENGFIIRVRSLSGKTEWDANVHNNGMCQRIIEQMSHNMSKRYPEMKGGYKEETHPVYSNDKKVGTVDIGYYGPFFLNDNDLAFINTLNKLLIGVGIFSLLFALVLGGIIAKRISTPLTRVTNTAQMIAKGYFGDRITEKSNTKEICQLTCSINDLAHTLEMQEALRKRLTGDVAHELRTPLATLQSHMEAMMDGIWEPSPERLKSCHEEIIRINRMVGDLEKLARFEGENLVLNKSDFDVAELAQRIIHNFERDYIDKGVKLDFYGEEEMLYADRDKISQVIVNLLSNALKFTPAEESVELEVKSSGEWVEIGVKDSGAGISDEDLPHIFERFYRADKSRNRLTGGAGIGLTITKSIVDAHEGKIEVKSKLNEGSEFRVFIPKQVE